MQDSIHQSYIHTIKIKEQCTFFRHNQITTKMLSFFNFTCDYQERTTTDRCNIVRTWNTNHINYTQGTFWTNSTWIWNNILYMLKWKSTADTNTLNHKSKLHLVENTWTILHNHNYQPFKPALFYNHSKDFIQQTVKPPN